MHKTLQDLDPEQQECVTAALPRYHIRHSYTKRNSTPKEVFDVEFLTSVSHLIFYLKEKKSCCQTSLFFLMEVYLIFSFTTSHSPPSQNTLFSVKQKH